MGLVSNITIAVGWVFLLGMALAYLAIGISGVALLLSEITWSRYEEFMGRVGTTGAATLVALPFAAGVGGALFAEALGDARRQIGSASTGTWPPSFIWWLLAAMFVFFAAPVFVTNQGLRRDSLVIVGRLRDVQNDPNTDDLKSIGRSIEKDALRLDAQWERSTGRRWRILLTLTFLAVPLEVVALLWLPAMQVSGLWFFGLLAGTLVRRFAIQPWVLRRGMARLELCRREVQRLAREETARAREQVMRPSGSLSMVALAGAFGTGVVVAMRLRKS